MLHKQDEPGGQVFAVDVLSAIKPEAPAAIAGLIKALESRSTSRSGCQLRWVAASALGEIGPPAKGALPALSRLIGDEDETVADAAASAIRKIQQRPEKRPDMR
jgi:HEAT repeat protein